MIRARLIGDVLPVSACRLAAPWVRPLLPDAGTRPRRVSALATVVRPAGAIPEHGRLLGSAAGAPPGWPAADGGPAFLVRVDDFPRWDRATSRFGAFHAAMGGRPYLLGVSPAVARPGPDDGRLGRDEIALLERVLGDGASLALHGLTHRSHGRAWPSEFAGRPRDAQARDLDEGLGRLAALGLPRPRWFIAPFNTFDGATADLLAERELAFTGGPESVHHVGLHRSPSSLAGALYLPSHPPAYGRAAGMTAFVDRMIERRAPALVALTLHWAWEERTLADVERLMDRLSGRVVRAERAVAGAAAAGEA
jgi:hypothetical protein